MSIIYRNEDYRRADINSSPNAQKAFISRNICQICYLWWLHGYMVFTVAQYSIFHIHVCYDCKKAHIANIKVANLLRTGEGSIFSAS